MPTILGFFSPLKNSPTTILVMEDPISIPDEIFLIIPILKFYLIIITLYHLIKNLVRDKYFFSNFSIFWPCLRPFKCSMPWITKKRSLFPKFLSKFFG